MSTYKIKRKKPDGTLEDVILQGVGGGPRKISSNTTTINIQATTVGAYFNIIGNLAEANELTVGGNSISLDSERSHCVRVEGMLTGKGVSSPTTYYWRVMVTVSDDSATGTASTYTYYISTTSGFNISDTGQVGSGYCRYTGILSE